MFMAIIILCRFRNRQTEGGRESQRERLRSNKKKLVAYKRQMKRKKSVYRETDWFNRHIYVNVCVSARAYARVRTRACVTNLTNSCCCANQLYKQWSNILIIRLINFVYMIVWQQLLYQTLVTITSHIYSRLDNIYFGQFH